MRLIKKTLTIAIAIIITGGMAYAQLKPGMEINASNAELVRNLVPEPVFKRIVKGEYVLKIGKLGSKDLKRVYSDHFYKTTAENQGKYQVLKNGGIVETATGKRITLGPGFPFPEIDLSDPMAGAKIMWNFISSEFHSNSQEVMWVLRTLRGRNVEVEVIGKQARLSYDFRTTPIKREKGITYKEISLYLAPADLFGTVTLTWRWQDPKKWDTSWIYTPSLRRIRRISAANRSDPVGATDYMIDDVNGYAGKVEFFDWKVVERKTMLLPYLPDEDGITVTFPRKCRWYKERGAKAFIQPRFPVKWAYQEKESKLAPWWPLNIVWVERPVYIVEGVSKDPYYSLGKQLLIIDAETYRIHIKLGWDRGGTYWRTQVMTQGYYISPDRRWSSASAEISFLVDEKRNRASTSDRTDPKVTPTIFNVELSSSLFSMSNFVNYGK